MHSGHALPARAGQNLVHGRGAFAVVHGNRDDVIRIPFQHLLFGDLRPAFHIREGVGQAAQGGQFIHEGALAGRPQAPLQGRNLEVDGLAGVFALGGDVFLSIGNSGIFFVLGLGSFSLAHILYTAAFCSLVKFSPKDLIPALIIAVPTIGFLLLKDGFDFGGMFPLIVLYTILISVMVSKAISLLRLENKNMPSVLFSIIGAVLFFISDFILVFVFFYDKDFTLLPYLNLIIYYSGQALLALSFLKGFDTKKS